MIKSIKNLIFLSISLSILPGVALAYIDPGSGSYLFQLLLGALFGALFFFKSFWQKVFSIFRRAKKESNGAKTEEK